MTRYRLTVILTSLFMLALIVSGSGDDAVYIAENLSIRLQGVDNLVNQSYFSAELLLTNTGSEAIRRTDWAIYFCFIRMLQPESLPQLDSAPLGPSGLQVSHVDGCLFEINPMASFEDLPPGGELVVPFLGEAWMVARTDVMPNWYVVSPDAGNTATSAHVISSTAGEELAFVEDFTEEKQYLRGVFDQIRPPTGEERHGEYSRTQGGPQPALRVIPQPAMWVWTVSSASSIQFNPAEWVVVSSTNFSSQVARIVGSLGIKEVDSAPTTGYIEFVEGPSSEEQRYRLIISPEMIQIRAGFDVGAFYAVQTFLILVEDGELPVGTMDDYPRFGYRGLMLDVSRNFLPKDGVLKILEMMARYKLNHLHLHLADDEGWRLEIPTLSELTQVGSLRCHDLEEKLCILPQLGSPPYSEAEQFYTAADYKEILSAAAQRHIVVIPEIDMPGHAHAAIKSMEMRHRRQEQEQGTETGEWVDYRLTDESDTSTHISAQLFKDNAINPCINSTYNFIQVVVAEIQELHSGIQPLTTFHFGGDEVPQGAWVDSPACEHLDKRGLKAFFTRRVSELTAELGLNLGGWEDGLMESTESPFPRESLENEQVTANAWNNIWEWGGGARAYILANAGYQVILSHATHLYFDHPHEPDPEERGYYWATRYTHTEKLFSYMPDDIYANIKEERMGNPLNKEDVCGTSNCPDLENPENIIGMQAHIWSETMRTSDQLMQMLFPRLLAFAERSWHRAPWEMEEDEEMREADRLDDWRRFARIVGEKELRALEERSVPYHIRPPGASNTLDGRVNATAEFPGQTLSTRLSEGRVWKPYDPSETYPSGALVGVRASSFDASRHSRIVTVEVTGSASLITYISTLAIVTSLLVTITSCRLFR